MQRVQFHSGRLDECAGVALLEFVIVAPLILFLCVMTYDVGQLLGHHFAATQVAREGVRRAVATPGLLKGRYRLSQSGGMLVCQYKSTPSSSPQACSASLPGAGLLELVFRIYANLERQNQLSVVPNTREILLDYGYPDPAVGTITVRMGFSYAGYSPLFQITPIGSSFSSSYL